MSLFDRLFRRRPSAPPAPPGPPELLADTEEDFVDCGFAIERSGSQGETRIFHAVARHQGVAVAIDAVLGRDWAPVSFGPATGYRGEVRLRSAGAESDALLGVLDREFGTGMAPAAMVPEVAFAAITLKGDPRHPERGVVKIKLFFEPEIEPEIEPVTARHPAVMAAGGFDLDDDRDLEDDSLLEDESDLEFDAELSERYVEWYLNVDVAAGRLELREKDPDYRAPIIRLLADGPS